jgi:hypothetical protein
VLQHKTSQTLMLVDGINEEEQRLDTKIAEDRANACG